MYNSIFFYGECSPCPLFILWVPQDRREKEGPQCLKWAVSQRPWSFPSCRNLITNNRWHITGPEMQGRFVCARTKGKCACWCGSRKKWQKKKKKGEGGRVFTQSRPSFSWSANVSAKWPFAPDDHSCVSKLTRRYTDRWATTRRPVSHVLPARQNESKRETINFQRTHQKYIFLL